MSKVQYVPATQIRSAKTCVPVLPKLVPRKTLAKMRNREETLGYALTDEYVSYQNLVDFVQISGGQVLFVVDILCTGLEYKYIIEEMRVLILGDIVLHLYLCPASQNHRGKYQPGFIHAEWKNTHDTPVVKREKDFTSMAKFKKFMNRHF